MVRRTATFAVGVDGQHLLVMSAHRSTISDLPHALDSAELWRERLGSRPPALFLDYDGVLTPIVDDPAAATLGDDMREAVRQAADRLTVAVISGRDLDDVRAMVDLPGLAYAGSHGFDMLLPDGSRERKGDEYLDDLDAVERALRDELADAEGVTVERKRYAIAVHTRRARDEATRRRAGAVVDDLATDVDRLRVTGGREIKEFRPDLDWDKGRALVRLTEVLDLDVDRHPPVYFGDDLTDEDAFAAIAHDGVGVVVAGAEDRPTAAHVRLDHPGQTEQLLRFLAELTTKAD
ncbi:MAG TPA: trehalose-phosphatase [Euzebyales bacterium]|nr:trehalose-phosphatase [Euzebyales bacterium]